MTTMFEHPPLVAPCKDLDNRPVWSVMIPAYNCSRFLPETLRSVLQQDKGPEHMQIEVIDDNSTDADVQELVHQIGKGRVQYFRQPQHSGSLKNFHTCINRSKGHLVHLLHGDDLAKLGFYEKMQRLFNEYPKIGAGFCRYEYINEEGKVLGISKVEMEEAGVLKNWLTRLGERQRIQTPAKVVRRSVYERLGSFFAVHYGEDWEMWLRIAAHYPVGYLPEIQASYRRHSVSITGRSIRTGQNIRDIQKVLDITEQYFPASERKRIRKIAEKNYAHYAVNLAGSVWRRHGDYKAMREQLKGALQLRFDAYMVFKMLQLAADMVLYFEESSPSVKPVQRKDELLLKGKTRSVKRVVR